MPLFLTVNEGSRADVAKPILATSDPRVIRAAMRAIGRLGDEEKSRPAKPRLLRPGAVEREP
jgi:HEAT repeat protein